MFETQLQEQQDQEITLGTGRLLGLFFGLVVICALFFSLGFSLGKRSATPTGVPSVLTTPAGNGGPKPTPTKAGAKPDCAPGQDCPQPPSTSDELTFYKAVEQNEAKAQLDKPADSNAAASKPAEQKAPEMEAPVSGGGYMVQIAAVTKQEDADALVNALKRKSYPVFTTTLPNDKLFHVQVGPFADIKDAEAVRAKLVSDGYNPILKR
jgi:DedD protein